ncbi:MAG: hypothetical protein LUD16_02660 [Lachnospiraceae bacterium]|nr:hypothetical protein [Lachnospiraceae bacterium]
MKNEDEQILSEEVSDGRIYLETCTPWQTNSSQMEDYKDTYKLEDEEEILQYNEYVIDEETKEILEMNTYIAFREEKILYGVAILDRDPEAYTVDEELYESIFGGDTYTLTVIADAGTEDETVYTKTASKGVEIDIYYLDEFESTLYTDPACTQELSWDDMDYTTDLTVYLKRVEE